MARHAIERRKLTVPQLAQQWGVATKKVIGFIRNGELRATNLASRQGARPRYAIDVTDIEIFEVARRIIPDGGRSTTQRLRRRVSPGVKVFV